MTVRQDSNVFSCLGDDFKSFITAPLISPGVNPGGEDDYERWKTFRCGADWSQRRSLIRLMSGEREWGCAALVHGSVLSGIWIKLACGNQAARRSWQEIKPRRHSGNLSWVLKCSSDIVLIHHQASPPPPPPPSCLFFSPHVLSLAQSMEVIIRLDCPVCAFSSLSSRLSDSFRTSENTCSASCLVWCPELPRSAVKDYTQITLE